MPGASGETASALMAPVCPLSSRWSRPEVALKTSMSPDLPPAQRRGVPGLVDCVHSQQ